MAGLACVNKFTQPNTPGSPARPQAPRGGPSIEIREYIREVARGASEVLLAASERLWVCGTLSLVLLLALSTGREGALY